MSALTETGLVNLALREIGTYRIEDIAEHSAEAEIARDLLPETVRFCLSAHEWRFAMTLAELMRLSEPPAAGFAYAYQLPGDFIRLGTVAATSTMQPVLEAAEFEIADGKVLASTDHIFCRYVYHHTTYGAWPPWFTRYVTAVLASEFASPLKSTVERERLEQLAVQRLGHARSLDSVQTPVMRPALGRWHAALRGAR